jgi:hypothetical protein
MSYSLFSVVDFGTGKSGLTTVGYRLYDRVAGFSGRITAGVAEITDGKYGALVTYPDDLIGAEVWDSGEGSPIYALNVINLPSAGGGGGGGGGDPWPTALPGSYAPGSAGYIIGHLNPSAVTVLSPVSVSGGLISVRAGDSWSIPINGLGNISAPTKFWFSVNKAGAHDSLAKLFIELAAGLTVVNGAPYTPTSDGSITVTDAALGNITITVQEAVTKLLAKSSIWTIKMLKSGNTVTLAQGKFAIASFGVEAIG